jgi:haloalkane dehalogenase
MPVKRVLLTTVHRPLDRWSGMCTEPVPAEMLRMQGTRFQGAFAVQSDSSGWALDFLAANIETPATVLRYPSERDLIRELRRGYDFVAIEFVVCTFPRVIELCALIRRVAPQTKIVLGGYGTVLPECDQHADYVCREEAVNFLRRLLGERPVARFQVRPVTRTLRVLGSLGYREAVLPAGRGCDRDCGSECTDRYFERCAIPILRTGQELHEAMRAAPLDGTSRRDIGVIDVDFLADRGRIEPMIPLNQAEVERPILFSCMTSLSSLAQYTTDELLAMGLGAAWIGVESCGDDHPTVRTPDVYREFGRLRGAGIVTLACMIVGLDCHDEQSLEEDFQQLIALRPQFSQFTLYSPCPQTPRYAELAREGRLRVVPYGLHDGFHALVTHPTLSTERLEGLVPELFRREYEELGPSLLRVTEVRLEGYMMLRYRVQPHLQARAREYRNDCLRVYPLMGHAIRTAPSERVRRWAIELREELEDTFEIPASARWKAAVVPAFALWTQLKDRLRPFPQPRSGIRRYRH